MIKVTTKHNNVACEYKFPSLKDFVTYFMKSNNKWVFFDRKEYIKATKENYDDAIYWEESQEEINEWKHELDRIKKNKNIKFALWDKVPDSTVYWILGDTIKEALLGMNNDQDILEIMGLDEFIIEEVK